jgi:pentose-5-phosphate-3-epimerase
MNATTGIEIVPTCVPSDSAGLSTGASAIRAYSGSIHVDVTDGIFASAITWPYVSKGEFGKFNLSGTKGLSTEVHLMTKNPRALGIEFALAGADRILGHVEAFSSDDEASGTLLEWKENGAREVGLGALLLTPIETIEQLVPFCDVVHFMTIASIGTQGIPYDARGVTRIAEFHSRFPNTLISVDGGVAESNIIELVRAGARRFGIGSAISKAPDPAAAYEALKALAESAIV